MMGGMIDDDLPSGFQDYPAPGWPLAAGFREWAPVPVQVGKMFVPRTFHTSIFPVSADDPHNPAWALTLMYLVDEGEVLFSSAVVGGMELPEALEHVKSVRPLRWWQRRALVYVAVDEAERQAELMFAEREETEGAPDEPAGNTLDVLNSQRDWSGPWGQSRQTLMSGVRTVAQRQPLGKRRGRLTDEHFQEVAAVYRAAWKRGDSPTKAVADHFDRPHSTAADWVLRARRKDFLGESDGTRGGEQ